MNRTYQSNSTKMRTRFWQLPVLAIYAFTLAAFVVSFGIFAHLITKKQSGMLFQEKIQAGKIGLSHFVNTAAMPLLEDDALSLNVLMKEAKAVEGVLYVAVVDKDDSIKAHTDIRKIGSLFGKFGQGESRVESDGTVHVNYRLSDGTQMLDLSRPVNFMQKKIGAVHVGLSLTFINEEIKKERAGLIRNLTLLGGVSVCILLVSALWIFWWLSRTRKRMQTDESLYIGDEETVFVGEANDDFHTRVDADDHVSMAEMNRNHVTVLFAGIKGFMAYAEINDHQRLLDDLNDYLSVATQSIQTYGGHIDKFVGDSVIAVFGNTSHEVNHAERAVKAAVAMQKALQESGKNGNPLLLKVGIGINSGVVLSGRIGSSAQNEQVFIGESIKVAYSLNFMAGPGEIVLTRDAYRMVEHLVAVEPLPPRVMMQRTQPWENFRLLKLNS